MEVLFEPAPSILPAYVRDVNLLRVFIWYVTVLFVASLAIRLRFYSAVYAVTRYVARSCPNVFRLIHEHLFLCVRDRLLSLVYVYGGILVAYLVLSRWVWTDAYVSPLQLAELDPAVLLLTLVMSGAMVAVDLVLTLQASVIDKKRVIEDLKYAESWLGSRWHAVLNVLGRWNPIKNYADHVTAETMLWLNVLFRGSMRMMILQTSLRIIVGTCLFVTQALT